MALSNWSGRSGSAATSAMMCSRIAPTRELNMCEIEIASASVARAWAAFALLSCSSQSRTFGSASKVISSWICFGVASSLAAGDRFAAAADAAAAPDSTAENSTAENRIIVARQPLMVRKMLTPTVEPTTSRYSKAVRPVTVAEANRSTCDDPAHHARPSVLASAR